MYRERLAWKVKRIVKYHILQYWLNKGRMYAHLHVIQHYFTVIEWGWHLSVSSPKRCTMQCAQNLLSASSKCLLRLDSKSLLSNKTKCFWSGFIPSTSQLWRCDGSAEDHNFWLMLLCMCVCVLACVCVWIMILGACVRREREVWEGPGKTVKCEGCQDGLLKGTQGSVWLQLMWCNYCLYSPVWRWFTSQHHKVLRIL